MDDRSRFLLRLRRRLLRTYELAMLLGLLALALAAAVPAGPLPAECRNSQDSIAAIAS